MKVDEWLVDNTIYFYHMRGKNPVMEMDLNVGVLFC